ncbi:MAG TPA: metallophosphoesterase [Solirubrobacteraceae bacterium]|nr:metallophosphoesterase [Solirubrobacteraceae bacterium]
MRTLIVSDLHLGLRTGADVLRRPLPLARLLAAIDDVQRLVLLGDTLELGAGAPRTPGPDAERVLRAIGERVGPDRPVIMVPGNHDGRLVRAWALERDRALGIADEVPPDATPTLAALVSWLAPARVRVSYPGVWLDDRVWATHGHYLDRHLVPESTFGLLRSGIARTLGRDATSALGPAQPIDYEWARRRAAARRRRRRRAAREEGFFTRLRDRPLGTLLQTVAELAREGAMPQIPQLMMRARLTPATARLIDAQMRRSAVPAMAEVVQRLGVDADWVVFGHVHRLGPRTGLGPRTRLGPRAELGPRTGLGPRAELGPDADPDWQRLPGGPRLLNTGAWLYEPMLLDQAQPPHPYWPGGAVLLESGAPPRPIGLLDDLTEEQLTGPAGPPAAVPSGSAQPDTSNAPAPSAAPAPVP